MMYADVGSGQALPCRSIRTMTSERSMCLGKSRSQVTCYVFGPADLRDLPSGRPHYHSCAYRCLLLMRAARHGGRPVIWWNFVSSRKDLIDEARRGLEAGVVRPRGLPHYQQPRHCAPTRQRRNRRELWGHIESITLRCYHSGMLKFFPIKSSPICLVA